MTAATLLAKKFNEIFDQKLTKPDISHHQAYEDAEKDFETKYGFRKYTCFDSFRISRSKRIRKKGNRVT